MFVIYYTNGTGVQKVCRRTNRVADTIGSINQLGYSIVDVKEIA